MPISSQSLSLQVGLLLDAGPSVMVQFESVKSRGVGLLDSAGLGSELIQAQVSNEIFAPSAPRKPVSAKYIKNTHVSTVGLH